MPLVIPGTTSLGLSSLSFIELRESGTTPLSLIYDTEMSRIDGQLVLTEKDIRIPVLIADRMVEVPVLRAQGTFSSGDKSGTADFYILDNKNNPLMVQSKI